MKYPIGPMKRTVRIGLRHPCVAIGVKNEDSKDWHVLAVNMAVVADRPKAPCTLLLTLLFTHSLTLSGGINVTG